MSLASFLSSLWIFRRLFQSDKNQPSGATSHPDSARTAHTPTSNDCSNASTTHDWHAPLRTSAPAPGFRPSRPVYEPEDTCDEYDAEMSGFEGDWRDYHDCHESGDCDDYSDDW